MHEADRRWQRRHRAHLNRRALRERAIKHMGGACRICGYAGCPAAYDFHHLEPGEKDFDISSKMSWTKIEAELRKCVLLCARCHREVHDGWHPKYLPYDEDRAGIDCPMDDVEELSCPS